MNGYVPGLVWAASSRLSRIPLRGIAYPTSASAPLSDRYLRGWRLHGKDRRCLLLFNDVQHIEVLKGPQGTLFGRNSAAGAISVVTNQPTMGWGADAKVRFGNYGEQYYEAMVNAPLGPDLAARVTFVDNRSDGWLHDSATGERYNRNGDWGTRAQLLWHAPGDTRVNSCARGRRPGRAPPPARVCRRRPDSPSFNPSTWLSPSPRRC
jgi:iron complex outermembrane receptor protein